MAKYRLSNDNKSICQIADEEIDSHLILNPFLCDICGLNFQTQHWLDTHTRKHTGQEPVCR